MAADKHRLMGVQTILTEDTSWSSIAPPPPMKHFRVNKVFLVVFNLLLCLSEVLIGYVGSCTNQLTATFNALYPEVNENQALYQGLIGSAAVFGMTIGAFSGG